MKQTQNLGLKLPEGSDWADVTALNENMEALDEAVAGKADLGEDGKISASQLPAMNYDPAGSAAAVQANLAAHMADKNNPHGLDADDVGARPSTWVPTWGDVTGKPDSFPPSGHTHDASQITSGILSAARGGTGAGSVAELAALLKSNGIAGLQTGRYQGTGTYGMNNPTVFQFDSPKTMLFVGAITGEGNRIASGSYCVLPVFTTLDAWVLAYNLTDFYSASRVYFKLSADRKTLSVYATDDAGGQSNAEGYGYFWAAI